jgi:hypothetical protein
VFSPGIEPGAVAFEHELIAEYLAARYLVERLFSDPGRIARALAERLDFADLLIARFMAGQIRKRSGGTEFLKEALKTMSLPGLSFTNLLQLLLMSDPGAQVLNGMESHLEGRRLDRVVFEGRDLDNISFRNCVLTDAVFRACGLKQARFEGARLSETRFEKMVAGSMIGSLFGDLEHFESVYVDKKWIESRSEFAAWALRMTGQVGEIEDPCPSSQQLRTLFLKYVRPDGTGRRDEIPSRALTRGRKLSGAPSPEDCLASSLQGGYLQPAAFRDRVRRVPGDPYGEMVHFVRDWRLTPALRAILDGLCDIPNCRHVPVGDS